MIINMDKVFELLANPFQQKAVKLENGWIFSPTFRHFQKRKKNVYVYVTPQLFGRWTLQLYPTGYIGICSLEARVEEGENIEKLFALGEEWLDTYQNSLEGIEENIFHPFHANGWQGQNINDRKVRLV